MEDWTYTSSTTESYKPVTIVDILRMKNELDAIAPPLPKPNRDQCKGCGKIMGKQFGGLIDVPAEPVYADPFPSSPACYVCPDCLEELKKLPTAQLVSNP